MKEPVSEKKNDALLEADKSGTTTQHLYGLRPKKLKKTYTEEKNTISKSKNHGEHKQDKAEKTQIEKDATDANSKEKKKKKSRKRKSKHSSHSSRKKAATVSEFIQQHTTESEDAVHNNGDYESIKRNPGVVIMDIKEEVIDPEYERVLLYSEVDAEDDPSRHVSFQEADEEDEFFPQTDDEGSEANTESGLKFSDIGDEMPLIMEVKQEVEDQGYAVINQWNEAADFEEDDVPTSNDQEMNRMGPLDIKKEIVAVENFYDTQVAKTYKSPHNISSSSRLLKFLSRKIIFWIFRCPLCSSQQVFLHKFWLQQHLEEPFHTENGTMSPEAKGLLEDLQQSDEIPFCPVETCQIAVEGSIKELCKHLLTEHIESVQYVKKLCQINVFCQETQIEEGDTKYSLTVQLDGKWHTFYRTKTSSEIHTLIKEDSVEFFPVAKIIEAPKMKMTVKVNKNPIIMKPTSCYDVPRAAPRDCASFCFDDITYYKCPICPTLTVFFDVLCLKNHMIKKSHQLSSVCRVLKEIGVQHPTHTCPVVNCKEDFGKSQKKQLKHIMTEHPDKYDILKRLMDGCYQNFQSISGIKGCIGGLQGLGIPQLQTINVSYKTGGKLPPLKPKPSSTSICQNQAIQPQQQSSLSLQTTSTSAVLTPIQTQRVSKSALQMFPSSQTVRQILDSKMATKQRVAVDSVGGSPTSESTNLSAENVSPSEIVTNKNGIATFAWSDSNDLLNDQHNLLKVVSTTGINKPRPICYKCGINSLSNIGLISHLFNDHCNLICKICSFTASPLTTSNKILKHMKDVHNIGSSELELNIYQSLPDICQVIGVPQLDGLSCITQKKFILDELVVHYSLVDASCNKFENDLMVRQVKKDGDEVWIEILAGVKPHEESGTKVLTSSYEVILDKGNGREDTASSAENNRNPVTVFNMNDIASSSESIESDAAKSATDTSSMAVVVNPDQTNMEIDTDTAAERPIGKQTDFERVSPSSGYNSPIRRWLIEESIKEIRLEKVPFTNSLHCLRCDVTASTNRGFLLHIFACHSIDVCKLCFFDLSKSSAKRVKSHLLTHFGYNQNQPLEDYLTLSCPEFMQLLGIPSLDKLCNITRDRIIFTFRVVWYRMAQVPFDTYSKSIMQKNLTVNSSPKAGTPDIILFFRNKHGTVIQVEKECETEVTKETSFRPERNPKVPCYVALQNNDSNETVTSTNEGSEKSPTNTEPAVELETTRQFVEGKDFTIVLQGNDRVFKCLKCTRAYWNKCKMRRHLKVHLNIRNYQCHLCQKSFHYNYHLKAHMNIHNNSRPYKCTKCSKSYNNSGSLSWHVRQCHGLCNFSKNKVNKIQCQVCYIQVRQELYHEHLIERHGVSVAYQYVKSKAVEVTEDSNTEKENEKETEDAEDDTSQDEFPWRGELIVDEGDGDDNEPDNYDLAPATAQSVFTLDGQEKVTPNQDKYARQEVYQCTFCDTIYSSLQDLSMHACPERHKKAKNPCISKKSLQNYTETYTCSKCKRTSLLLETFVDSSHPCALNSESNFMCEKTYTCKLCQLIFTNLAGVRKHFCEDANKVVEGSEEEPDQESTQTENLSELSLDLTCPVCSGTFSMTELPYHLSSKHHLNKKVVFELMHQNALGKK